MNSTKQLGDTYKHWKRLNPFPPDYSFKQLKKNGFPLSEGTLYVVCGGKSYAFQRGEIIKLVQDDDTINPLFTNGTIKRYKFFSNLAILPTVKENKIIACLKRLLKKIKRLKCSFMK